MRHKLALIIGFILLTCGTCAAQAPADGSEQVSAADTQPTMIGRLLRVELKDGGSVRGQYIYLRDIAAVEGSGCPEGDLTKALDAYVGTASVPGGRRILTRGQVLVRLRAVGFSPDEIEFSGPEKLEVLREAQIVTGQEIRDLAFEAVRAKLPWPAEDVTIEVVREPQDVTVGQGAIEVRVDESFGYRGFQQGVRGFSTVSIPIEVLLDGNQIKRVTVPIRVRAYATVAVAAADIARSQIITEDMLTMTRLDVSSSGSQVVMNPKLVVGKRATQSIRAGRPLTLAALEEPPVVSRGDSVTVVSRFGSVVARAVGEARREGRVGDTIPIRVSHCKRELQAVVVDSGTVEVQR